MRIARWAFTILLLAPLGAASALAQDQDTSVAAAARRAQEQKKDQPKAAKVYDNDHLPTGPVNVVGQEQPVAGSTDAGSRNAQTVEMKPAPTASELAGLSGELDSAKQRLADLKADLDVGQRKYALDQATYYGKPNYAADKAGAAALASEKSDIDAKADAVAAAEKALADAQAKLDAANQTAAAAAAQEKAAQAKSDSSAQAAPAPPPKPAPSTPASVPNSDR
jgi:colicin import membrane protein